MYLPCSGLFSALFRIFAALKTNTKNMMDEKSLDRLDAELVHAGEETQLSPRMLLLEQLRITVEKELKPMEFLFRLFGKPCFPRRELVAITGKAKSGKTFVTSMLMARGASPLPPPKGGGDLRRNGDAPLRVLWYDTEQSDESTQDILRNRVMRMVYPTFAPSPQKGGELLPRTDSAGIPRPSEGSGQGWEESLEFHTFNVRAVAWKDRRELLREAVERYVPDLVVVDGIRDLVNDINDGVLAQEVMEELMHLAATCNCCIVCVLHQNKGSEDHNLRGWIGTELMNKAFEVFACEKLLPQRIFKVEQTLTRKYDIEQTMYFEVGSDGLPKAHPQPLPEGGEKRHEERLPSINREYIVHDENGGWQFDVARLFLDAMRGEEAVGGGELRERVMRLSRLCSWKVYNRLLEEAVGQKVVEKSMKNGRTVYRAAAF